MVLSHKVLSLRLLELSQPHLILLTIFADSFSMYIMIRGEIAALIMVILVICSEIVLRLGFSLGIIMSRLPLLKLMSLRVLLLVPAQGEIVYMHFLPVRNLRHPQILLLIRYNSFHMMFIVFLIQALPFLMWLLMWLYTLVWVLKICPTLFFIYSSGWF